MANNYVDDFQLGQSVTFWLPLPSFQLTFPILWQAMNMAETTDSLGKWLTILLWRNAKWGAKKMTKKRANVRLETSLFKPTCV